MKNRSLLVWLCLLGLIAVSHRADAQKVAVKTNFAHWALLGSPNAGVEYAVSPKMTINLEGGLNMWKYKAPLEIRHIVVQPELRYWFCESFNGAYIGLHAHGGKYNVGGITLPVGRLKSLRDQRYEGKFYGAGIDAGYQWVLSPAVNLELNLGGGWARTDYRQFNCATCGLQTGQGTYDYFGLTKAGLTLLIFLK
ncbi:MAG: DUF3575 domain-containing protein [Porphyromonas sp.]|nr:DUF3575 domain-containing protein [Porphyromonas sp.]